MPRIAAIAVAAAASTGCLDPLVDDKPGASANILPADAMIPAIGGDNDLDLLNQVTLNDGLDTRALMASGGVIVRGTGASNDAAVRYWAFGAADRAPAPMYVFGTGDPTMSSFQPISHLPLVEALPGDRAYNPVHTIYRVAVTDRYHDEKITTTGALADAIQIGLVQEPVAIKSFLASPIVRPGTMIEVATDTKVAPTHVYARGHIADIYQFGGAFALQPNLLGLLPTSQVSFLRGVTGGIYDPARPVFQAQIPTASNPGYTPLSVVVNVDLTSSFNPTDIRKDGDLFARDPVTGAITAARQPVALFAVTATTLFLQLQYVEGSL